MELFKPEAGLLFWALLSFTILFIVLSKYAWPQITKGIKDRNKHIEDALASAEEANKKLDSIKEESEKMINEARQEQLKVLREAGMIKENMLSEARLQAKTEATSIIEDAHRYINRQKVETMKELENKVVELSVDISEKILRKTLDNRKEQEELARKLAENLSEN